MMHSLIATPDLRTVALAASYLIYVYAIYSSAYNYIKLRKAGASVNSTILCCMVGTIGALGLLEGVVRLSTCLPVLYYPMSVSLSVLSGLVNLVALKVVNEVYCPVCPVCPPPANKTHTTLDEVHP